MYQNLIFGLFTRPSTLSVIRFPEQKDIPFLKYGSEIQTSEMVSDPGTGLFII